MARTIALLIVFLAASALEPRKAYSVQYGFIKVAETGQVSPQGQTITGVGEPTGLSDGKVVFSGTLSPSPFNGLFVGDGGPLVRVVADPTAVATISEGTCDYAFNSDTNLFAWPGPPTVLIGAGGAPPISGVDGYNDAFSQNGVTVLSGFSFASGFPTTVLLYDGTSASAIVRSGDMGPRGPFTRVSGGQVSNGDVLFLGDTADNVTGLYTAAGGQISKVIDTADQNTPDIGHFGEFIDHKFVGDSVVFSATYPERGAKGIFRLHNAQLERIASGGDGKTIFSNFGNVAAVDNMVLFEATLSSKSALYLSLGGAPFPVIKGGDSLFGSTVKAVNFYGTCLEDDGKFAFKYELMNGKRGIAIGLNVPADFDSDGVVGPQDLAIWSQHVGLASTATRSDGDADGDRDVDGADFVMWQTEFGFHLPMQTPSTIIPEPGCIFLLGLSAALVIFYRRRTR